MFALIVGVALIAGGISLCLALYFAAAGEILDDISLELFKFCLTAVLAGGGILLYKHFTDRDEDRKARHQREHDRHEIALNRLEDFFQSVTRTYNRIKFLRRELRRALAMSEGGLRIEEPRYVQLMMELNGLQLELEEYRRKSETKPFFLKDIPNCGYSDLSGAEKYIRQVTKEYEDNLLRREGGQVIVDSGSHLFQFVISRQHPRYDGSCATNFFQPLDRLYAAVSIQLSHDQQGLPSIDHGLLAAEES